MRTEGNPQLTFLEGRILHQAEGGRFAALRPVAIFVGGYAILMILAGAIFTGVALSRPDDGLLWPALLVLTVGTAFLALAAYLGLMAVAHSLVRKLVSQGVKKEA